MKLSVVIPVFNEEKTITEILKRILSIDLDGIEKELVIVNDCSRDNTIEVLEGFIKDHPESLIRVYSQEKNMGKGGQHCIGGLKKPPAIISLFRTQILSTTPGSIVIFLSRFSKAMPMWFTGQGLLAQIPIGFYFSGIL